MKPIFSIRRAGQQRAIDALACCFFWRTQVQRVLRAGTRGVA
jgi:hypothetical protein